MRLSIGIVFLIGVMVASEVICDPGKAAIAAQVRTWFETIVHRLETGQTLKQNGEFIEAAVYNAYPLLRMLNIHRSPGSLTRDYFHSDHFLLFDQIVVAQNDIYLSQLGLHTAISELQSRKTLLESILNNPESILNTLQSEQLENELDQVTNTLQATQDMLEVTPHWHVTMVLEAIRKVLLGDVQLARAAINKSKLKLECTISVEVLERQYSHFKKYDPSLKIYQDIYPTISTYVIENTNEQTATIRDWIGSESMLVLRKQVGTKGLNECVSEIAQELVNYLPDDCLPEGNKFIGRPIYQDPAVVANRILAIVNKIDETEVRIALQLDVELKRDVLKIISQILLTNFKQVGDLLDESYKHRPESVVAVGDIGSFEKFINSIYGNVEPSSSVNN